MNLVTLKFWSFAIYTTYLNKKRYAIPIFLLFDSLVMERSFDDIFTLFNLFV